MALLKQVWVESEPIRRVHEARLTAKRQLGTDPRIPLPGRACGGLLRMWGGVATGRPACQRATRVLRCAPVLRMTRRPSLRSESSYGPCGPAWTGASRPSTTSRRTREEQSARGPDVRGSRGEAEPANAGVFLAGAASNWGHPYPHLFQETQKNPFGGPHWGRPRVFWKGRLELEGRTDCGYYPIQRRVENTMYFMRPGLQVPPVHFVNGVMVLSVAGGHIGYLSASRDGPCIFLR